MSAVFWRVTTGFCAVAWLIVSMIFLNGCCAKPAAQVVYKDVYIPVKCEVTPPERPILQAELALNVAAIVEYARELELAFKACKGE